MAELELVELYERNNRNSEEFSKTVDSQLKVKTDYAKRLFDKDWIDFFLDTIPYLENIFRNPNRFIENEEEIVKIELAKKITVESVKHLAKHTNLITEMDEETGDVKPSKILNINKEENYNTYENRVIYTLVQNMKFFIHKKKQELEGFKDQVNYKNNKEIEYNGNCQLFSENINVSIKLNTALDENPNSDETLDSVLERIKKVERRIRDLSAMEVYKVIDKAHITLVRPPIRRTNLILKNVNFQYAMKLWNYLQDHLEDESQEFKEKQDYVDEGSLKKLVDENFLLNYLVVNTLDKDRQEDVDEQVAEDRKKMREQLTEQLIEQLFNLNPNMTSEELQALIGEKFALTRYRSMATLAGIQKIFKRHIDKYLEKVR